MACTLDFRGLDEGFGGKTYKRKREEAEAHYTSASASMEIDEASQPMAKRSAVASEGNPDKPIIRKPSYDGVISGRVSDQKWKQTRKHRASATQVRKGSNFEERKKKEIKKAYKERITELKETIRQNKVDTDLN